MNEQLVRQLAEVVKEMEACLRLSMENTKLLFESSDVPDTVRAKVKRNENLIQAKHSETRVKEEQALQGLGIRVD